MKKIEAPKINAQLLWGMSPQDFNNWRKIHDYPRIITFFKESLPLFREWMLDQKVNDEILIEHTPSNFLRKRSVIYIYTVDNKDSREEQILRTENYKIGDTFFYENLIKDKLCVIPYTNWFYNHSTTDEKLNLKVTSSSGRTHYFMNYLGLLDLGNCVLPNYFLLSGRNLDFTSLDDLKINFPVNNTYLRIWFSSAANLSVEGDLPFVDAYVTSFGQTWNTKKTNLKLINGTFQFWSFIDCELYLNASNTSLFRWNIKGSEFNGTFVHSDIKESRFLNGTIKHGQDFGKAREFHAHVKRIYSQLGKRKEASKHYFSEKTYERKTYLKMRTNYRDEYLSYKKKNRFYIPVFYVKYLIKYLYSSFLNILWGYGKEPSRVFRISILSVFMFAIVFCYSPHASPMTNNNLLNSLYYSLVTFTTLGYGEIYQTDSFLKILSGFEAILGMSFWGILIAGFANNSKDY